jgi:mutator protein MutT
MKRGGAAVDDAGPATAVPRLRRVVRVVAGVLADAKNRVLLAQRPEGKHLAGGWEFPGGKTEPGETRFETLARELDEELGIEVTAARPLICVRHQYAVREILLDVWVVTEYRGEPAGLDGQALRWCPRAELPVAKLLPADQPIVTALRLPERITQTASVDYAVGDLAALAASICEPGAGHVTRLHGVLIEGRQEAQLAAAAGADFLVLRKSLDAAELAALCASVHVPVFARGLALEEAWSAGAIGVSELAC